MNTIAAQGAGPRIERAVASRPAAFLMTYVRARRWQFSTLALLVIAAGSCAVAVQYGMKLIVDAMASTDRMAAEVWPPLMMFIGLIAVESILWRLSGWLGCRARASQLC